MKRSLTFFLFIAIIFFSSRATAQCAANLNQAQDAFDNGHLYGIPALLNECINKGSKQDKIEAFRLLTLTYLYIDDPIAAQNSFLSLLKLDPEYRVDSTNQVELLYLSKEFISTPIVSWRARGGINLSNISSISDNGSNNSNLNTGKYEWGVGWSAIGSLDIHYSKLFSFSIESEFSYSSFKYFDFFFNNENGIQNSKDKLSLNEKSWNYSMPLSFKITYPGKKFYPYAYAGYSPNYSIVTNTNAEYINNEKGAIKTEDKLNITSIRNHFSHSAIVGIGLKRRINYQHVFLDVRYKIGLTNRLVRDSQNNFEQDEDINKYSLVYLQQDNDFRQNELSVTVGYIWPKYKPRKRKSVTSKSFIENIFKKKKNE